MPQSSSPVLKKRYQYKDFRLSDPQWDEVDQYPDDDDSVEDIPFEEIKREEERPNKKAPDEPLIKDTPAEEVPLE